jgi:hypothetical protein
MLQDDVAFAAMRSSRPMEETGSKGDRRIARTLRRQMARGKIDPELRRSARFSAKTRAARRWLPLVLKTKHAAELRNPPARSAISRSGQKSMAPAISTRAC